MHSASASSLFVSSQVMIPTSVSDIFSASSLADKFLPAYDIRERYAVDVCAPRHRVYQTARSIDLTSSRIARFLFNLREYPSMQETTAGKISNGIVRLEEHPDEELLLGTVGRFWNPLARTLDLSPESFLDFEERGYAKVVISIRLLGGYRNVTRLTSETRVQCLGPRTSSRFRLYWAAAKPLSGHVRREMLWTIKRTAEST
jgi:hypothetical protein